ncbi:complement C1q-like protein 4 isoform X1 [Mercenaria mercenaria]|uniref:complement C1q-like protein 4 isoform X1 n=1 Tax=Mercenaria mercenaria TaxID=6596 RepID=UPI00234E4B17|nr:complement C1q-like protein 4 isoform X1 [Mercenaria mercenaria]
MHSFYLVAKMENIPFYLALVPLYGAVLLNAESVIEDERACSRFEFDHKLLENFVRLENSFKIVKNSLDALEERVNNLDGGRRSEKKAVAFTATLDHEVKVGNGDTLTFNNILNNAGNGYNSDTGIFTAPIAGTYIFAFHIEHWETKELTAQLMLDNTIQVSSVVYPGGKSTQSGNTAVIGLQMGQTVWVKTSEGQLYGSETFHGTTFSGALLY